MLLKREKLGEIDRDWRSFTDYVLHTVFLRDFTYVDNDTTSNLRCHLSTTKEVIDYKHSTFSFKKEVLNQALFDGINKETLQLVFIPNEFPYNLANGSHWTLWYNTSTQPYDNGRITEDISAKLRGCQVDDEVDFGWYVIVKNFLHLCAVCFDWYRAVIQA